MTSTSRNSSALKVYLDICQECSCTPLDVVTQALGKPSTSYVLDLSGTQVTEEDISALCQLVCTVNITELDFWSAGLRVADIAPLVASLRVSTSLSSLLLKYNLLGDDGTESLAQALEANTTLARLDLEKNQVGPRGACALATLLQTSHTLRDVHVGSNPLGGEGLRALAQALKDNSGLERLNLTQTNMSDTCAKEIAVALRYNQTLSHVYIGSNPDITEDTTALITLRLRENVARTSGIDLSLSHASITGTGIDNDGNIAYLEPIIMPIVLAAPQLQRYRIGSAVPSDTTYALSQPGVASSVSFYAIDIESGSQVVVKVFVNTTEHALELTIAQHLGTDLVSPVLDHGVLPSEHVSRGVGEQPALQDLEVSYIIYERPFESLRDYFNGDNVIPYTRANTARRIAIIVEQLVQKRVVHTALRPESFVRFANDWKLGDLSQLVFAGAAVNVQHVDAAYCAPEVASFILAQRGVDDDDDDDADDDDAGHAGPAVPRYQHALPANPASMLFVMGVILVEMYTPNMFANSDPDTLLRAWANNNIQRNFTAIDNEYVLQVLLAALHYAPEKRSSARKALQFRQWDDASSQSLPPPPPPP